jgi:hypothetical protein
LDATAAGISAEAALFSESPGRFLIEIAAENVGKAQELIPGLKVVGKSTAAHSNLHITSGSSVLVDQSLSDLKGLWKGGLVSFY